MNTEPSELLDAAREALSFMEQLLREHSIGDILTKKRLRAAIAGVACPVLSLEETETGFLVTNNSGPTPARIGCNTLEEGLRHLRQQADMLEPDSGDCFTYTLDDWQRDVASHDTQLSFIDWRADKKWQAAWDAQHNKPRRTFKAGQQFAECGCCGHVHRAEFFGDCRDDSERFTSDELERLFGYSEFYDRLSELEEESSQ